jgi:hypothetical protein
MKAVSASIIIVGGVWLIVMTIGRPFDIPFFVGLGLIGVGIWGWLSALKRPD